MIRSILVPATGSSTDDACHPAALAVARQFSAHLDFLHVRQDIGRLVAGFGDAGTVAISPGLVASIEQSEDDRAAQAKQKLEAFCAREHVTLVSNATPPLKEVSARWCCETGDPAAWMARYGQTADLTVVARPEDDDGDSLDLLQAALVDSGRPIYIPGPVPVAATEIVAVAWKPTREAARAVAAGLPFLAKAKRVVVLAVTEDPAADSDSTARLVAALQRQHLSVEARAVAPEGQRPADRLLTTATALGAHLLVMGGYGHNRLREWIFGGFTQHVLDQSPVPVLMAH